MQKTEVIILAAGHGKRMQSDLPKALMPLSGKALIQHVLDAVSASGNSLSPIIVVGQKREQLMSALGEGHRYAVQEEQLGTGNAVLSARDLIAPDAESVLVLYADHPFVTPETIHALSQIRQEKNAKIVMATVALPDFNEWRSAFLGFSRVIRGEDGMITRVVEAKDASEEEKKILEVNPAFFCFEKNWLLESLPKIGNKNAQGEYYLTDLVKLAFEEGLTIPSVAIPAREAIGTNSKEDLDTAASL